MRPLKQWVIITHQGDPIWYRKQGHIGIDLRASIGTGVYAPVHGTMQSTWGAQGGRWGILYGEDGIKYRFAHLSRVIRRGHVSGGDIVALSGNSGALSSGAHLHLDMYRNGWIDPEDFFKETFIPNNKIMFGRLYSSRGSGESPFELNGRRPCLEFDGKRHGFVSEAIFNKLYGGEFELGDAPSDAGDKEWGERVDLK